MISNQGTRLIAAVTTTLLTIAAAAQPATPESEVASPEEIEGLADAALDGDDADSNWRFTFAPYIWAPSLSGDIAIGRLTIDADASFKDVLDAADSIFALMGTVEGEYQDKFVFQIDATYMDLGFDETKDVLRQSSLNAILDYDVGWYEFFGGYRFVDRPVGEDEESTRRLTIDGFVGGRITSILYGLLEFVLPNTLGYCRDGDRVYMFPKFVGVVVRQIGLQLPHRIEHRIHGRALARGRIADQGREKNRGL